MATEPGDVYVLALEPGDGSEDVTVMLPLCIVDTSALRLLGEGPPKRPEIDSWQAPSAQAAPPTPPSNCIAATDQTVASVMR